jgi:hypothetical protein
LNWSKTKGILVIALLFVNILLLYKIFWAQTNKDEITDNLKDILNQNGIGINKYVNISEIDRYNIEFIDIYQEISKYSLEHNYNQNRLDDTVNIYKRIEKMERSTYIVDLKEYLEELGYFFSEPQVTNTGYILYQMVNGFKFEDGKIEIFTGSTTQIRLSLLKITKLDQKIKENIVPIENAILIGAYELIGNGIKDNILETQIVYKLDLSNSESTIKSGEPYPFWKLTLEANNPIYVNGLR